MNQLRVYAIATCFASLSAAGCGGNAGLNGTLPGAGSTSDLLLRKPSTGTFREYRINGAHEARVKPFPIGITNAPDGALWFAERGWGKLGRITTDGTITNQFSLKVKGQGPSFRPQNVVAGPDGDLWATCGTLRTYLQESQRVPDTVRLDQASDDLRRCRGRQASYEVQRSPQSCFGSGRKSVVCRKPRSDRRSIGGEGQRRAKTIK